MKKKDLLFLLIPIAIIIAISSDEVLNLVQESYESFSINAEAKALTELKGEAKEAGHDDELQDDEFKESDVGFTDILVRRERLTQSYMDQIMKVVEEKIVYLTFDDGPTPVITNDILDILAEEGVEATFFVLGQHVEKFPHILQRIHEEGHIVGNHTYSHNYSKIYRSPDHYMEDLLMGEEAIKAVLGEDYELTLTRFPGGSFGGYKGAFRRRLIEEGYVYIDWNSLNGDSEKSSPSKEYLISRFKQTSRGKDVLVVLMHDGYGKSTTVETLPYIINYLKEEGYRFKPLPQYIETEIIKDLKIETSTY
ncbi:polysaccharide deacetylase family protein [Alkaliphilus transvaalensis]|uniref:polysaccharide deacetylase family protein n=1 Tax=Alkaliphilus transvaalensis TaxID=114628 RepID=UPI0006878C6C|nr:polysaccharide deacetylase family protein [Alkaliphilus transvaalensis]